MKLETGHPICSLCKLELTSFEDGPGTKLCASCRGLIQTAFHRAEPRLVSASAAVQLSGPANYVQSGAAAAVHAEAISPIRFEDFAAFSGAPEQSQPIESSNLGYESFEMHFEDEPSTALESEMSPLDGSVVESTGHQMHFEDEPSAALDSQADSLEAPVVESPQLHNEIPVVMEPSSESIHSDLSDLRHSLSDNGNAAALPDDLSANNQFFAAATAEPAVPAELVADDVQDTRSMTEATPADPWEDPLPAWDYSRTEWPVLMGPPRRRSLAKFKLPAALILILALGAGFYYLIYPKISRDHPLPANSVPPDGASGPRAETQKPAEPVQMVQSQAPSTLADAPATAQVQPEQKTIRDAGVAGGIGASEPGENATGNSQGRFTLQAAAFPTKEGADELAEKLKSAGLPSYVVSADLARRGRWFRVRVGRFNTAEEAQKFAGEAQQRAKAAGVSLQLIVSQYDQP